MCWLDFGNVFFHIDSICRGHKIDVPLVKLACSRFFSILTTTALKKCEV